MNAILQEIRVLSPHEKLQLVEDLWDMIDEEHVPVGSPELYEELERRSAWALANPGQSKTLEEIAFGLGVRL